MHEKDIKRMAVKQLKKEFPYWNRLTRKEKKLLAKQVLEKIGKSYPFDKEVSVPIHELTGVAAIKESEIMTLPDMERFVSNHNSQILRLSNPSRVAYLKDRELKAIDELVEDAVINSLIAPDGYTPSMREIFPSQYLRAELLKSLKYPELSYRKYCSTQLNNMEQKMNRAFVRLPLNKKLTIDHSQLSQFRSGLTFSRMVNLMVYFIHLFLKSGRLDSQFGISGIDSSELAAVCNPSPLATLKVGKKKVRIYADLDADCGTRRNKRDRSKYFVGYRLHCLTAINPHTGHSFPLISLIAPGNHHDTLFLPQLTKLGKAIGLDLKVITADEGYGDAKQNKEVQKEYGITVLTPAGGKVKTPAHVEKEPVAVYMDQWCENPMEYLGKTEDGDHEFRCGASPEECIRYHVCHKHREIAVDAGLFGQIPAHIEGVSKLEGLRKNIERPFNLLKHREGLEPVRVRSQQGLTAVATFATISNLLLEIVDTRRSEKKDTRQCVLKLAA